MADTVNDIKIVGLSNTKPKSKTNWKVMGAIIGIVVLAVGVIAGIILVRQNQNIEEKAACVASCPSSNGHLINCYNTLDTNGDDSVCNEAGRIEICGSTVANAKQYCCPAVGGTWTANLTLCASAATPTATATATATSTATSTSHATATATATATGEPNSCGGTCGSNTNCGSGLFCYIVSGQTSGFCRNASCSTDTDCNCGSSTATATSTTKPTSTTKANSTTKASGTATARPIPVTGVDWPTMLGAGFGIVMILVSLALAL